MIAFVLGLGVALLHPREQVISGKTVLSVVPGKMISLFNEDARESKHVTCFDSMHGLSGRVLYEGVLAPKQFSLIGVGGDNGITCFVKPPAKGSKRASNVLATFE